MKRFKHPTVAGALALSMALLASGAVSAADARLGDLSIDHPWARESIGRAANGAAYMTIENHAARADRLVSAATPAAERAELHTHIARGTVMEMRQVEAIDVPANGSTSLAPGGLHVMLFGLRAPLKPGDTFPLTLTFEMAGPVTFDVAVEKMQTGGSMNHGNMGHGKDGKMPPADAMKGHGSHMDMKKQ
jgi:copper(I)-binding protein